MRLIDADALIERLRKARLIFDKNEARFESLGIGYAIEIIEQETPTISQWIPCSERLPSKSDMYLCSVNNSYRAVIVMNFYRDRVDHWEFMNFLPAKNSYVIAWMPLPEAYKERSE